MFLFVVLWLVLISAATAIPDDNYLAEQSGNRDFGDIIIHPSEMDFGTVMLSEIRIHGMDVQNMSPIPVNISHYLTADDGSVNLNLVGKNRSDSLYYTLNPYEMVNVEVIFTPQALGAWTAMVYVYDETHGDLYSIPMMAMVVPTLIISPPHVDFGLVLLGEMRNQLFSLFNDSGSTMNISHYVTADDGSVNLNLVGKNRADSLYYILPDGESQEVELTFTALECGDWHTEMIIHDFISETDYYVPLHAYVTVPLVITPTYVNFGDVLLGSVIMQMFDVYNDSDFEMNIGHYVTGDDGSVNLNLIGKNRTDSLYYNLLPYQTQQVQLVYTAQGIGPWDNSMRLYDFISGAEFYVPLQANVLPLGQTLSITPTEVHFGEVMTDETRGQMFEFTNYGDMPLDIGHYVTGDDGSVNLNLIGKSRSDSLYFTIQPYQTEQVMLEYTPQTAGPWSCDMYVYDYTNGTLYQIIVDAYNIPAFYVTPQFMDFGPIAVGYTFSQTMQIVNPNNFSLDLQIETSYQPGSEGCVDLVLLNGLRPDSLTTTVPSQETLFVDVRVTPSTLGPGGGEIYVRAMPSYNDEIIAIAYIGESARWCPYEFEFGTVYISSKISDHRDMISYLNSGIDVSAYAASNPSQISLTGEGTPGGRNLSKLLSAHSDINSELFLGGQRNRPDSLYFYMEPLVPYPLTVIFRPVELGVWSDTLLFYDHTNDILYQAPMTANVLPATLLFSPQEIDFGDVTEGLEVQFPCAVQNNTPEPVYVGQYSWNFGWTGLSIDGGSQADSLYYLLQPFETRIVTVTFYALEAGPWSGLMHAYDYTHDALYEITLTANVFAPPDLVITPMAVDLGIIYSDQVIQQVFDLTNFSDYVKNISFYLTADDGSVNLNLVGKNGQDSLNFFINPNQTRSLIMSAIPQSLGAWNCNMQVLDFNSGAFYDLSVTACVYPRLLFDPPELDLGQTKFSQPARGFFWFQPIASGQPESAMSMRGINPDVKLSTEDEQRVWADSIYFELTGSEAKQIYVKFTPQGLGNWMSDLEIRELNSGYISFYHLLAFVTLDVPEVIISKTDTHVQLSWAEIPLAQAYSVFASDNADGPWLFLGDTALPGYMVPILNDRKFYQVTAKTLD